MGPLKFTPLLKRIRWGGRRLGKMLGKAIGTESDYAESWEICDHGVDQSVVMSNEFTGWTLQRLVRERAEELLGRHAGESQFPLLIKFLDACDRLSVQVHPNDAQAHRYVPGERGKTEAWIILAAKPGSCVYSGLRPGVTCDELRQAVDRGSVEDCLHRVEVAAGDCLFIPAGTVHAIGEGILLAEVQQSSDLTFRLDDWNRTGTDGKPRDLHVEQSLACTDFARGPVNPIVPTRLPGAELSSELLVKCPYFTIHRHTLDRALSFPDDRRCRIFITVDGAADCACAGKREHVSLGDTVLIPASGLPATLEAQPQATVLEVFW